MSGLFTGEQVIIKTADLAALVDKIEKLSGIVLQDRFNEKLDLLCEGNIVNSKVVKRLMGWSEKIFQNRLKSCEPMLPMKKNTEGRWEIAKEDFLTWYNAYRAFKY
jgi:hypothetical protein